MMDKKQGRQRIWRRWLQGAAAAAVMCCLAGCSLLPESVAGGLSDSGRELVTEFKEDLTGKWEQGVRDRLDGLYAYMDGIKRQLGQFAALLPGREQPSSLLGEAFLKPLEERQPEKREYTLLVYMVGSDLESNYGCASADIEEMLESGLDFSSTQVLVCTGGSKKWKNGISSRQNSVYQLTDRGMKQVAATDGPENMGDGAVFADFLNYGLQYYPAEHVGLICWDHGNGPLQGFGNDQQFGYDSLTLEELDAGLSAATSGGKKQLDWIGYDACLMGSLEIAQVMSRYAGYLVASEETIPGIGWNYEFLQILNETSDPEQIARAVIDSYARSGSLYPQGRCPDLTLSCMELSRIPQVTEALSRLCKQMEKGLAEGDYPRLARIRDRAKRFGMQSVTKKSQSHELVDLKEVAEKAADLYPQEADALCRELEDMVVYQTANVPGANGVSIYYPYDNKWRYQTEGHQLYADIPGNEAYKSYLDQFAQHWAEAGFHMDGADFWEQAAGGGLEWILPQEQAKNLSAAYYHVFAVQKDGTLLPVLTDCRMEQEDCTIYAELPSELCYIQTAGKSQILAARQLEKRDGWIAYQAEGQLQAEDPEQSAQVSINFAVHEESGQVIVTSILEHHEEGLSHDGKKELSLDGWKSLSQTGKTYLLPEDETRAASYEQWQEGGSWESGLELQPDTMFRIAMEEDTGMAGQLYYQVVLEDVSGDQSQSELMNVDGEPVYGEALENQAQSGPLDRLTDRMRLVTMDAEGGVVQMNQDHGCIIVSMESGKGADIPYALYDNQGNRVLSGYEEAIWMTDSGYFRTRYCYPGTDQEADAKDIMNIALHDVDGEFYRESYSWQGELISLEKTDRPFVSLDVLENQISHNVNVSCEQTEDGFVVKDASGAEIGHIVIGAEEGIYGYPGEVVKEVTARIAGNWLIVERGFYCLRIYWIED